MLNMVRAELFRMAHERMLGAFLAVIAVTTAASAVVAAVALGDGSLAASLSSTSSDLSRIFSASSGEAPILSLYGSSFVNGSVIAMAACCYVALFAAKGVGGGKQGCLAKNVLQAQGGRAAYAAAQFIVAAVAGVLFVAVGVASCALFYGLAGFPVAPGSLAEFALWAAQVWCAVFAYEAIALTLSLATGSRAAGTVFGLLLGGFAIEKVITRAADTLAAALGSPSWLEGASAFLADGSLMAQLQMLGHGEVCGAGLYVVAGIVVAASAIVSFAIMKRRSLG